jgi:hypothetical protein
MLVKGVTKNGDAIPLSPREALPAAMAIAVAAWGSDFVHWLGSQDFKVEKFDSTIKAKNDYDAVSTGTCLIGKTRVADDRFYAAKPYSYDIHFKSSRDEIGTPHVSVVSFKAEPLETDPSKLVGEVDTKNEKPQEDGEIKPQAGGRVKSRR